MVELSEFDSVEEFEALAGYIMNAHDSIRFILNSGDKEKYLEAIENVANSCQEFISRYEFFSNPENVARMNAQAEEVLKGI